MDTVQGCGAVRLIVENDGKIELSYHFGTLNEAMEIFDFIRDFFPNARYVIEPALH
ncbi:MAG: hypothetical protein ACFB03_09855 [Paracoccaceae bacterium]